MLLLPCFGSYSQCICSSAVVGTMFLITRIWDTFLDPFVGILGDRTSSRWGKFRPYLLWIAIPFGICGILTFSSFGDNMTTKIIFAYATYTLMMMVYSLINVPYASLLGVMSANPQVRTEFSSYRMTFEVFWYYSSLSHWLIYSVK